MNLNDLKSAVSKYATPHDCETCRDTLFERVQGMREGRPYTYARACTACPAGRDFKARQDMARRKQALGAGVSDARSKSHFGGMRPIGGES